MTTLTIKTHDGRSFVVGRFLTSLQAFEASIHYRRHGIYVDAALDYEWIPAAEITGIGLDAARPDDTPPGGAGVCDRCGRPRVAVQLHVPG